MSDNSEPDLRHTLVLLMITVTGFGMAAVCFRWFWMTSEIPVLLLALVTFGMSYDFLSHLLGTWLSQSDQFLQDYSRLNFAALCFGIPFTAYAGTFVMARVNPAGLSAVLANYYLLALHASVVFGLLFLFARYKKISVAGATEFTLDKTHTFTRVIFILRRILLAAALVAALLLLVDGWNTEWRIWALLFVGVFLSSIPLHIMHKQISSMLSEVLTQALAMYATWMVIVAPAIGT